MFVFVLLLRRKNAGIYEGIDVRLKWQKRRGGARKEWAGMTLSSMNE